MKCNYLFQLCFTSGLLILCNMLGWAQQDPINSNYLQTGLAYNPAYAGNLPAASVTYLHRSQWPKLSGPVTQQVSLHAPIVHHSIGVGGLAINDRLGMLTTTSILLCYSYKINFSTGTLAFGLSGGIKQFKIDPDEFDPKDPDDEVLLGNRNYLKPASGTGILFSSKRTIISASIQHLIPFELPAYGIVLKKHFYASGSYIFFHHRYFQLVPSVLLKKVQGILPQADFDLTVRSKQASLDIGYRTTDFICFKLLLSLDQLLPAIGNSLNVGYAYDHSLSGLGKLGNGANELFIQYNFALNPSTKKINKKSTSISPAFF